ncbi:type IV pilus assembly protein FimV [Alkalisalibacterium limincola]|uniref:FimV N-terminal domain-containing protein n=1 Tax=Alkalisalibacterium limincola TaxID=2699169 RepID=A0A5C8KRI0_9GAMM|nr:FimV/HubP family polar landmark protein [Alkalisalibacterium limincola]TXK62025.1 hypothetical protein FU658_09210 [Alkalisalibacterium limincola]
MRKKILSLPLLLSLGLASGHAAAVGLGQIEVQSRLNQPLVAEIRLLQVSPAELERMHVRLASPEAFSRVGLDRPSAMTANLQFSLDTNARGEPVIRVTTPSRVNDPFLSFLLEIEWGAGRLVREYNVLLDPPYMAPATRAQVAPATTTPAAPVQPAPAIASPRAEPAAQAPPSASEAPAPLPPAPAPVPAPVPPPPATPQPPAAPVAAPAAAATAATAAGGTFTVATGQTLSSIANRERDADVSVNQMMIALLRANPDAFIDGNINLLRAGAVMRLPSRDEVVALRAAEANAMVSEQVAAWNARRAPVPQPAETPRQQPTRTPVASGSEARLAIVPPSGEAGPSGAQSGAAAGGEGTQLRVELTQAEEEIAARDAEIEEMRSRMDELEALAERQARMIELRSQEMEDMQRQLREAREGRVEVDPAAGDPVATATPWYRHPLSLGGLALLVVGGLVWLFTRRRREPGVAAGRAGSLAASIEAARSSSTAPVPVGDDTVEEPEEVLDDEGAVQVDADHEPLAPTGSGSEGMDDWGEPESGDRPGVHDSRPVPDPAEEGAEPVRATPADLPHDADGAESEGDGSPTDGEPVEDLELDDWGIDPGEAQASSATAGEPVHRPSMTTGPKPTPWARS